MSKDGINNPAQISLKDLAIDETARGQLETLKERLIERNRHVNLTAITDPADIDEKHFADSLAIGLWQGFTGTERIVDIGCGAGFPGLPVKIVFPAVDLTSVDAVAKKIAFVQEVFDEIGLAGNQNVEEITGDNHKIKCSARAIHARAEEIGRDPSHRGMYDLALTRAVAPLAVLVEYALPLLKKGGHLVAYKQAGTEEAEEAAAALAAIGGEIIDTIAYSVPGGDGRELIVVRKTVDTPDQYPRRTGKPSKKPIM